MDSSSTETKEKQSRTGSKATSKAQTVASKLQTTDKSGQKVQSEKAQTQQVSKKAFPPPQKKMQKAGLVHR